MHEELLRALGVDPKSVNYSVTVVSAEEIRELNKQHRGKDKVTDVLSFPFLDIVGGEVPSRENFPLDYNHETGKVELGDIVINEDEPEQDVLISHALLHLLGYHHEGDE